MEAIVTITFNPCIDKSTTVSALIPEKKLRCTPPKFEPGGGGINVARAIKKLGGNAIAIYPAGGYSGKFLHTLLQNEGIDTITVETAGHTRENLIVLETTTNQQYRFGMPGAPVSEKEWKECLQRLEDIKDAHYIVASGSLPPGIPTNIYALIAQTAKNKKAKLIIDTSGLALKDAVDEGVYLLKPNLGELSFLAGKETLKPNEVLVCARDLIHTGKCEVIVVSMGAEGALLVTKEESILVKPPNVKRQSTVGAGDSMVAGMVLSLLRGNNLKEVVQYGVACGTAATLNSGTELCKPEDVEALFKIIRSQS